MGHGGNESGARELMNMTVLRGGIRLVIGMLALCLAGGSWAQESLDRGKSPAQLFASDCSGCHKSPQGLGKSGGLAGLDSFLREHYTASTEIASAIASYLKAMGTGPAAPRRASKRTPQPKSVESKPTAPAAPIESLPKAPSPRSQNSG